MSTWLRVLVVPALMLGVASAQLALSERGTLHRWKGGGFAMFSGIEQRRILVHLADGARCLSDQAEFPEELRRRFERCAHHPTRRCLDGVVEELDGGRWAYYFLERPSPERTPALKAVPAARARRFSSYMPFPARYDRVLAEVWRFSFDAGGSGGPPTMRAAQMLSAERKRLP